MAPMETCTEERRVMLMGMRPSVVRILPLPRLGGTHGGCYHAAARISLFGESPARAGTPKAQIPPGNAQAPERQTAECTLPRGFWRAVDSYSTHPTGPPLPPPHLSPHSTEAPPPPPPH